MERSRQISANNTITCPRASSLALRKWSGSLFPRRQAVQSTLRTLTPLDLQAIRRTLAKRIQKPACFSTNKRKNRSIVKISRPENGFFDAERKNPQGER